MRLAERTLFRTAHPLTHEPATMLLSGVATEDGYLMWKWIRRRALTAVAASDAPAADPQTSKPSGETAKVPGTCVGLHNYLSNRYADMVVLTFTQLEDRLGFTLPDSARTQQEWWTGTDRDAGKSSCSGAWILAGRTATPNLLARTVTFERSIESLRDSRSLA